MDLGMVVAAVAGLGMVAAATVVLDLGKVVLVEPRSCKSSGR